MIKATSESTGCVCVCVWGGGGGGDGGLDVVTVCSLEGTLTQSDSATYQNVSSVRGTLRGVLPKARS